MTRWRAGVPERVADTCRSLKCASQSRYANARSFATACTGHPPGFLGMPLTSWRESRYRIITVCNGRAWHPAVDGVRYRIDGSTYRYWLWGRGIRRILLTSAAQPGRLGMVLCPFSDVCGTPSVTAFGRHAASVRERVIPARGHNGLSVPWQILCGALQSGRRAEGIGTCWGSHPGSAGGVPQYVAAKGTVRRPSFQYRGTDDPQTWANSSLANSRAGIDGPGREQ